MGRVIEAFAQFLDDAGDPLVNGWLKFLEPGTTDTFKNTYSDENLSVLNENPLQLDASGRCSDVFGTGQYRVISFTENIEDEADVGEQIQQFDPVTVAGSTTGGGGGGSFESWDDTTTYVLNDLVTYNTKYYRSLNVTNLNKNPAIETSYWEEIEFVPIWNTNVTYDIYEMVRYEGRVYFSLASLNSGNQPDISPSDWDVDPTIADTQTLTNKTIDADNNTVSNLAHGAEVDNPSSGVHGATGTIVGTSDTQTLTNKTIDADDNPISNLAHGSEVDNPSSGVHGATGAIVGTTDIQTLTNKTYTSPKINEDVELAATSTELDASEAFTSAISASPAEIVKAADGIGVTISRNKIVDFSGWNMDTSPTKVVPHGLTGSKIKAVSVTIFQNDGSYFFTGQWTAFNFYIYGNATNIYLNRITGGHFDSADFNAAYGSVSIDYID